MSAVDAWQPGVITGKFAVKDVPIDFPIAGWVNGPFGLDFRVFWDDDNEDYRRPGWVLTHLASGRVVRAMLGSLADAKAFADELARSADWNIADPAGPQHELGRTVITVMAAFPHIHFTTDSRLGPKA